ncbi:MAG: hypothetical protein IKA64_00980 [Clostridia bacterium]|nr:hypothetical protein [Clostridia bacterium]
MSATRILVLVGASAVGKTTVAEELMRIDPSFTLLRSATTRAPRGDGKDDEYIYKTREEFVSLIERGEVIEHMEYAGEIYGTPREELYRAEREGKTPLLILDIVGAVSVSKMTDLDPFTVYITGDPDALEARLAARYGRGTPRYTARMEQNARDKEHIKTLDGIFSAFVENDTTPEDCARRILALFSK